MGRPFNGFRPQGRVGLCGDSISLPEQTGAPSRPVASMRLRFPLQVADLPRLYRFTGDTVALIGPGSQIDKLAAFATERAPLLFRLPGDRLAAGGTVDSRHKLQQLS